MGVNSCVSFMQNEGVLAILTVKKKKNNNNRKLLKN